MDELPAAPGVSPSPAAPAAPDAELRALYAALPVGVGVLTPELRYERVNEALARINGRSVEEHIGASLDEVLGEAAAAQLAPVLRQVMRCREAQQLARTMVPPGATEPLSLEITYFPVIGEDGEILGVGGVVIDVTRHKALEGEQSRLLREALVSRAHAEAAGVRADHAREQAELVSRDAERGRARIGLLADAGRRMSESLDWETTLQSVVRTAVPSVADWAALAVADSHADELRVVAVAHADPACEPLVQRLVDDYLSGAHSRSLLADVMRRGRTRIIGDLSLDRLRAATPDREQLQRLERLDVRHVAVAPLTTPEGRLGALTFALGASGRRFEAQDDELLSSLTARAALHIHNARLYTERAHIAQTLQRSLLPDVLPVIPGLEVAVRYRAAGGHNTVGGDFYDVFRGKGDAWNATVGDVSGKGPEAAAVTALVRHTLRTAARLNDDPAANLALLSDAMLADSATGSFCTVVHCHLCPSEQGFAVRFANGGHPAPLLLRADGQVEAVETGRGPLVGAFRDARFEAATLALGPGELLLLYTDGVTEIRPRDLEFGEHTLKDLLAAHAGASAREVVAAVEARAVALQDGQPRDDLAIVALKVPDPAAEGPDG